MRWMAHYYFTAGWNVYSTVLAGHSHKGGAWPKVQLKEVFGGGGAIAAAIAADPALAEKLSNPYAAAGSSAAAANLMATLMEAVPELAAAGPVDEYMEALEAGAAAPAFEARFDSTATEYGEVAAAALGHVDSLPGPVVAVGSSVGGAAALSLAGAAPAGRVTHVLACAPLLNVHGEARRRLTLVLGPLGVAPMQGWSEDNRFELSCTTGTLVGGVASGGRQQGWGGRSAMQRHMIWYRRYRAEFCAGDGVVSVAGKNFEAPGATPLTLRTLCDLTWSMAVQSAPSGGALVLVLPADPLSPLAFPISPLTRSDGRSKRRFWTLGGVVRRGQGGVHLPPHQALPHAD